MTTTVDRPVASRTVDGIGAINATDEHDTYLHADEYSLTPRQIVFALAAHLARFGDTLAVTVVDPLAAIDAHMRFDGDLTGWTTGRTPAEVATILARAEQIACGYFGIRFPAIRW